MDVENIVALEVARRLGLSSVIPFCCGEDALEVWWTPGDERYWIKEFERYFLSIISSENLNWGLEDIKNEFMKILENLESF